MKKARFVLKIIPAECPTNQALHLPGPRQRFWNFIGHLRGPGR
jgi:hypothetical protein